MRPVRWISWLALGAGSLSFLHADPPSVEAVYPAGGQRGSEVAMEVVGKVDLASLEFWASDPGLSWQVQKDEASPRLRIDPETPVGAHWLRFYNLDGSAQPQLFVVGDVEERQEVEPNDSHIEPDRVSTLPLTLNGKLGKRGDVDAFVVHLECGQWLRAAVMAYQLDSPADPLLRLTDAAGNVLAWNHDSYRSLDPVLEYQAAQAGDHILMISGFAYPPQARSSFVGSEETVYRIELTSRSSESCPPPVDEPSMIEVPETINGVIQEAREEDQFTFTAVKGTTYAVSLRAQTINSPLDAYLEIRGNEADSVLAKDDDSGDGADPALVWKAPESGAYSIGVRDLRRFGGPDFCYELKLEEVQPAMDVDVAGHAWTVNGGGELSIPVKLTRSHGHARPVTLTLHGLPPYFNAQALTIPGNASEGTLRIRAPQGKASAHLFSLHADDGKRVIDAGHAYKGATTEPGALVRNTITSFLITVPEAPEK